MAATILISPNLSNRDSDFIGKHFLKRICFSFIRIWIVYISNPRPVLISAVPHFYCSFSHIIAWIVIATGSGKSIFYFYYIYILFSVIQTKLVIKSRIPAKTCRCIRITIHHRSHHCGICNVTILIVIAAANRG